MINIKLAEPVLLRSQIDKAAENPSIDSKTLMRIAYRGVAIATADGENFKSGDIISGIGGNKDADGAIAAVAKKQALIGAEGAEYYCAMHGVELKPIRVIDLPMKVYYECTSGQWDGISNLAARVETENNKILRLKELNCPLVILNCEARVLQERVQALETNDLNEVATWSDGTIIRCLNDIGYSLDGGWDDEMLEEFKRREAEEEKRQEQEWQSGTCGIEEESEDGEEDE